MQPKAADHHGIEHATKVAYHPCSTTATSHVMFYSRIVLRPLHRVKDFRSYSGSFVSFPIRGDSLSKVNIGKSPFICGISIDPS